MGILYCNGTIRTMDDEPTPPQILITEGASIVYTGPDHPRFHSGAHRIRDLHGGCLLPGFLDAHSHFLSAASALLQVDLTDAASPEALGDAIRAYLSARSLPAGQWIRGTGYDHNRFPDGRHPTRAFLDRICPDHPVILQHASGHVGVLNTRGLEALSITDHTPVPAGGTVCPETGLLEETAFTDCLRRLPPPELPLLMDACRQAQQLYASHGITTVQEGMLVREMIPLYQAMFREDLLRLDVVGYAALSDQAAVYDALRGTSCSHFRLGGLKIFLDGSPQAETAWMRTPYGAGRRCGSGTMTDSQVLEAVKTAAASHRQLLAHCNGDAACGQFLEALAQVPQIHTQRPVIIHGQLLDRDQLPAVRRVGAVVSFFAAHVYHWGHIHEKNFGPARAARISPARSALELGIPVTFHTDTPVIPPDLLETIRTAVTRLRKDGTVLGAREAVSVRAALEAVTRTAAFQYGEEDRKGTLTPGKQADLVILDRDPFAAAPESIHRIAVLETIKDGVPVYAAPGCR